VCGHLILRDRHRIDPVLPLYRKGHEHEARLAYLGHLVVENRHGLIVDATASTADGRAEREVATVWWHDHVKSRGWRRRTVGADKGFDTREFVGDSRHLGFTPHVAQNTARDPDGDASMIRWFNRRFAIRGLAIPDQQLRINDEGFALTIGRISASSQAGVNHTELAYPTGSAPDWTERRKELSLTIPIAFEPVMRAVIPASNWKSVWSRTREIVHSVVLIRSRRCHGT
jgi:hypothetical protein